jgi:YVTN family beta-propeller protein
VRKIIVLLLLLALLLPGQTSLAGTAWQAPDGKIVVANRASGSISLIDVATDQVLETIELPEADNFPEPMYVVYTRTSDRVFVGDRANNRVVVFNGTNFSLDGIVPTGSGVFHMWADPHGGQLWVNNDIDNTVTVIDTRSLSVLATVALPEDLVQSGGKPHDVILDQSGQNAFVTMLGFAGDNDYLVKFSTDTYVESGRVEVGKDPHLSVTPHLQRLYVPAQNSNEIRVFDQQTLELISILNIPGAHGAGMSANGQVFYTTNLTGGGMAGLFAIDTKTNTILGEPVDTPYPVPHNIALATGLGKLYVTHSGATADKVTVYAISNNLPVPEFEGEVTVELNPFGLTYVP